MMCASYPLSISDGGRQCLRSVLTITGHNSDLRSVGYKGKAVEWQKVNLCYTVAVR